MENWTAAILAFVAAGTWTWLCIEINKAFGRRKPECHKAQNEAPDSVGGPL